MLTMKKYAEMQSVSYEAIRKQVERYRKDLDGHIIAEGRTRLLDDYAVEFLNARRRENTVIVYEKERTQEEERLRNEVEELKNRLLLAQEQLLKAQELQVELIQTKAVYQALLESHEKTEADLRSAAEQHSSDLVTLSKLELEKAALEAERASERSDMERRIQALTEDLERTQADARSYERTWFGLYRKMK